MTDRRSIICFAFLIAALGLTTRMVAQTEATRFTNPQCKVSFQPPAGWEPSILVQYVSPPRDDGGRAVLTLTTQHALVDLSDQGMDELANESSAQMSGEAVDGPQVTGRKKVSISGLAAVELELSYKVDGTPMRLRHTYIPVSSQGSTYLFTVEDVADRFAESATLADKAINSFSLDSDASSASPIGSPGPTPVKSTAARLLPFALTAAIALLVGIAGTFVFLGRRNG
jgi:hypothetical protein